MRLFWASCILAKFVSAAEPPPLMLWAWEQPADLQFLAGKKAGVAYLAATAFLDRERVRVQYRLAKLSIAPDTYRMPVLRIEAREAPDDWALLYRLCERLIREGGGQALQIDFDAPQKLRGQYGQLLSRLRKDYGEALFLSMTVLAGWCDKAWFAELPVSEAVPMLFRMGPAGRSVVRRLEAQGNFEAPACRGSLGYSIDETLAPRLRSKRRYLFSPTPWSENSYNRHSR